MFIFRWIWNVFWLIVIGFMTIMIDVIDMSLIMMFIMWIFDGLMNVFLISIGVD